MQRCMFNKKMKIIQCRKTQTDHSCMSTIKNINLYNQQTIGRFKNQRVSCEPADLDFKEEDASSTGEGRGLYLISS